MAQGVMPIFLRASGILLKPRHSTVELPKHITRVDWNTSCFTTLLGNQLIGLWFERISEMSLSLPPKKDVHNMWKHMSLNAECHHFCEFSSPKKQPERATTILNDRPERFLTPSYETISYPGFPASSGCGDGAIFGQRSGDFWWEK